MKLRLARPSELAAAAMLLVGGKSGISSTLTPYTQVIIAKLERMGINVSRQVVAEEGGDLVGCCAFPRLDASSAHVMAPSVDAARCGEPAELKVALIERAATEAHRKGASMVQTIVETGDTAHLALFRDAGFGFLAELAFLERKISKEDLDFKEPAGFDFAAYGRNTEDHFVEVLEKTYEATLDCPRLSEIRTVNEILESHKLTGTFDPTLWHLVKLNGRDVGVILFNYLDATDVYHLTFMGVVADMRGRGIGKMLVRFGLRRLAERASGKLSLAVDVENWPARKIYDETGFGEKSRKKVLIKLYGR